MYSFRQIRDAILAATPSVGFPYTGELATEQLGALRSAAHLQELLDGIQATVQRAHAEPIPALSFSSWRMFEETGTRLEYERPYFARRGNLLALVLSSIIEQTDEHLALIQEYIWAICDEYSWCVPAHLERGAAPNRAGRVTPDAVIDLFAADTAYALAEGITLLGARLDPWIGYRIRAEIERRIFRPLFYDPIHLDWESVSMNWASACAGTVGMAALLLEPNRERLAGMIERCIRAMECFLEGYGADGGCAEGPGYWQYGFGYYTYFAEMLRAYTNDRLDLLQGEKIRRIAAFPANISLSGGCFVNFSDGMLHTTLATGLLSRLAERTGVNVPDMLRVPHFDSDNCYRWPHIIRNLLWTNATLLGHPTPDGTIIFDDLNWIIDRCMVGTVPIAFAAKGGHNDEPHNQNDLGHFILHIGGESLLADLGAGLYTKDYFGAQRYEHIHTSSEGHSVPIIEGQPQQPGRAFSATILQREIYADGLLFILDLKQAYAVEKLQHFTRSFRWTRPGLTASAQLVLTDVFQFSEQATAVEEVFISLHQPELMPGSVTWTGVHGTVTLDYDRNQFEAELDTIESRDRNDQPVIAQRLRLRALQAQTQQHYILTFAIRLFQE